MKRSGEGKLAVDRRDFLALGAGAVGALALNGLPMSAARALAAAGRSPNLPNYYPANVPPPDIPGRPPGYLTFPKTLVKSVARPPMNGGEVTGITLWGSAALPTPPDRNAGWQQLNRELGAELKLNIVLQADYAAKWGTITASGDLPDVMYISIVPVLPNVAAFVRSSCENLSEYLGGDAVKDFPNLANLPSTAWKAGLIEGELWGVPIVRPEGGAPMFIQTTLLETLGMAGDYPRSADDFKAYCKELTDPSAGRWAIGISSDTTAGPYSMLWFQGLFGAPNNWRLEADGRLVKDIETEEYKAALAYLRELVEAGYVSPDIKANADLQNDLMAGKIVMRANTVNGYQAVYTERAATLGKAFRILPPFGFDGGPGAQMLGPGHFGWTAIRKASPDRIREMLGMLDYLASPFGSEEFMVTKFGVKDVDWVFDENGAPKLTPQGNLDMSGTPTNAWDRTCSPPSYLFSSVVPDFARFASEDQARLIEVGVEDPTWGNYSPTDAKIGVPLTRLIFDGVSDIAAGRRPISDLDQLVEDWRARGGDQIRAEYEKAIAG